MNPTFNLIDDPWILAQRHDGTVTTIALTELFHHGTDYARIVGDLPTQALPILRLALAIAHQALDGPATGADWADLWRANALPVKAFDAYLQSHRSRFELFDSPTPFYQVADLSTKKHDAGLAAFIADVPTGHPKYATRAAGGLARISLDEAARWLVHCHAFDLSGIKGAAEGDPRAKGGKSYPIGPGALGRLAGVYPEGDNLFETLMLNLLPDQFLAERGVAFDEADVPVWERLPAHGAAPEPRQPEGIPKGLRDLFTWQSRRLRLIADAEGVTGAIICQGDRLELRNQFLIEPMTAWRRSENQERQLKLPKVYLPRRHDPTRNAWRGLAASLPALTGTHAAGDPALAPLILDWVGYAHNHGWLEADRSVHYHITGLTYGTQEAVITDLVDDRLTLAAAVFDTAHRELATAVAAAVGDAEQGVRALAALARDLARAAGDRDNVTGAGDSAAETGYAALDTAYRDWLAALRIDADIDKARTAWQQTVRATVLDLAAVLDAASGPAAWRGRKDGDRRLNSAIAQNTFRRNLYRALPLAFPEPADPEPTDPEETA